MGNTPSNAHGSPSKQHHASTSSSFNNMGQQQSSQPGHHSHHASPSSSSPAATVSSRRHNPNLRLPMPQRPTHISPQSSNPTSPNGGRSSSPRRRKSLELPDLNKLSFTPTAPVTTTATVTSHHLDLPYTPAHVNRTPTATTTAAPPGGGGGQKGWRHALGTKASPLAGGHALSAMSRLDAGPPASSSAPERMRNASVSPTRAADIAVNPYFPASSSSPARGRPTETAPIPIPTKAQPRPVVEPPAHAGTEPPPPTVAPSPPSREDVRTDGRADDEAKEEDGMVNVPIQWTGGGKTVYVTGNFADDWKGRIKLRRSTHDFNTMLRLPPGQYRLKFIVDDSWRCSKQISTATDDDGTLVNWIEVEAPKTEEEMKAEWAMDSKPAAKEEETDESQWTNLIPAPLFLYQYLEELPALLSPQEYADHISTFALSKVPEPPTLPRILDKVIVNAETSRSKDPSAQQAPNNDDNSILAVPNHVVLNHLTASAIKNGTLGVGTTTRYRKKYITTMFFKPTPVDLVPTDGVSQTPTTQSQSSSDSQSVASSQTA